MNIFITMGYILKNTSGLINTRLTDAARQKISQGTFNISYFQIGDSEVNYNILPDTYNQSDTFILEPNYNSQNISSAPNTNKQNVKYPFYVDGTTGNTYGIPFMDSIVSPVYNKAAMRGFFDGDLTSTTINWSAYTDSEHVINSNYVVDMSTLNGSSGITLIYSGCNLDIVRLPSVGDFITIFYDGKGANNCSCPNVPTPSPTPTPSITPSIGSTLTPTPTITQSPTDPCNPTPTPTPSATFCLTPTPSNPCPPEPIPSCYMSMSSCYPMMTYRIVSVCGNVIGLDRTTPDMTNLSSSCIARVLIYPPNMTTIYDSVTPMPHWNSDVINFESVCNIDQLNVKIWNMNIPWTENPAGLFETTYKGYSEFGSVGYIGTKEYLGYMSSSGQTFYVDTILSSQTTDTYYYNSFGDKIFVQPEEQKVIAIIHYTNQTIDNFYGEKFALEPFENVEDTIGQARNFKLHIPWIMWHKNPDCCLGETFWVDPPGFDNPNLNLLSVHYMESNKNNDMNEPGLRYYNLWDTHPNPDGYPNRVGKVYPDQKIIVIDDEEIVVAMSYKSNRNWTLPAPKLSLVTPNTCGDNTDSIEGILTGDTEYMYVTYRFTNQFSFTNSLHCNYYSKLQGPNICNSSVSQNVSVRFGNEFQCLDYSTLASLFYKCGEIPCFSENIEYGASADVDEIVSDWTRFSLYADVNFLSPNYPGTWTGILPDGSVMSGDPTAYFYTGSANYLGSYYIPMSEGENIGPVPATIGNNEKFYYNTYLNKFVFNFVIANTPILGDVYGWTTFNPTEYTLSGNPTTSNFITTDTNWTTSALTSYNYTVSGSSNIVVLASTKIQDSGGNPKQIFTLTNSNYLSGFYSPCEYSSYVQEVTVQSLSEDGDDVGVIISSIKDDNGDYGFPGVTYQLILNFNPTENKTTVQYGMGESIYGFTNISGNSISASTLVMSATSTPFGSGYYDGKGSVRVKITKNGNNVNIYNTLSMGDTLILPGATVNVGDPNPYSLLFSFDLSDSSTWNAAPSYVIGDELLKFVNRGKIGFSTRSQALTSFYDIFFSGNQVNNILYKVFSPELVIGNVYNFCEVPGCWVYSGVTNDYNNLTTLTVNSSYVTCEECETQITGITPTSAITIYDSECPNLCYPYNGFIAEKFEIICQKVIGNQRPDPDEWKIIDFTPQLSAQTINGYITAESLTGNTFVINNENYNAAPNYDLSDYINLTLQGDNNPQLNFGDEYYFYGSLETDIQATIYEMRYKINLSQTEFQYSSNPSWNSSITPYVTEIGLFDSDKNLMMISKLQSPVLRQGIQQFLVKFDF